MLAKNVKELIGNTPLVRLNRISNETGNEIYAKCEFMNPTSSVKDRLALALIEEGIKDGSINENTTIIEPTSGNTGIALAAICASSNLSLILTMPWSMSIERRQILSALGAKLVLTDPSLGLKGSISKAQELSKDYEDCFIPHQFKNKANVAMHKKTTAVEILKDLDNKVDIFITGSGTGGTFSGVSEVLKEVNPKTLCYVIEPKESPLLSGGSFGAHKIQGIGPNFIPNILNMELADGVIAISGQDAINSAKQIAKSEGLFVGISAGANILATEQIAKEHKGKTIVTVLPDTGERYLSSGLFEQN